MLIRWNRSKQRASVMNCSKDLWGDPFLPALVNHLWFGDRISTYSNILFTMFVLLQGAFLAPSNVHIETTIAIVAVQPELSLFSWSFLKVNIIKHRQHLDHACPSRSDFIPICNQRYRFSHL